MLPAALKRVGIFEVEPLQDGDILVWDSARQTFVNRPPDWPHSNVIIALVDAASVAVDAAMGKRFQLAFTSGIGDTRAMANPTNLLNGQVYEFIFDQDVTGGRRINSWGNKFRFSDGTAPLFTPTGSKRDRMFFEYDATAGKLDHLATQGDL